MPAGRVAAPEVRRPRSPSSRPDVAGGRRLVGGVRALIGALAFAWPAPAAAQVVEAPEVELEDVLEIALVGRDLVAYDLLGTRSPRLRLEIGEEIAWMDASGRIGLVVTDRRLLAVSNDNASWQEARLRVHESRPASALIGKRVALVVTDKRLLGFDATSAVWLGEDVGPNEQVQAARVGAQTALVLTDRTAYGLSPSAGGFFPIPISVQERVEDVRVGANMATVSTSRRVLVFRGPSGTWSEERRKIN